MIYKLSDLSDSELKQFYRDLSREITAFIGGFFSSEEELQEAFKDFKSDVRSYHDVMDNILASIAPQYGLTWRDLKQLNHKRFRLCRVCNSPFISFDKYNRTRICYDTPYKRFIRKDDDEVGHFVKYTEEGQSMCYAKRRRQITRDYRKREKYAS
jgi:hypothetical protein